MQQQQYTAEGEREIMRALWSAEIRDNPYNFVMFAYPWGKEGTPLAKKKGPRRWQKRLLLKIAAHIKQNKGKEENFDVFQHATKSGRGPGKSAVVSWLAEWLVSTRVGSSVLISANTENQLRSVTWAEMSKWFTMSINSHWWEVSATRITPAKWIAELVERDLKKGTRYWNVEGKLWSEENPDGYAGPHNPDGMMVIFDEASGIPDAIWPVAGGFFTEDTPHRFWFAFSNPRRNSGYFYECFNSKQAFWDTDTVDCRTVEDTAQTFYQQIIDEYGPDSIEAYVEVYGEFPPEDDEQFISVSLVNDAVRRENQLDDTAPIVIGVDPARFGADSTVIAVRQGRKVIEMRRFHGDDTMVIVGHVIDAIEEFRPALTCIDEGGVGAGVVDRLKEQRYKIRAVNFGWSAKDTRKYGNKRAEMWGDMKDWLRTGDIPDNRRLKAALTSVERKPDSMNAMFLKPKKDMRVSPDEGDAICLTFAHSVGHREPSAAKKQKKEVFARRETAGSWMGA